MLKSEFQSLKVGDRIKYLNSVMTITHVESEYLWEEPKVDGKFQCVAWKVFTDDNRNLEISDSIVKFIKIV